MSSKIKWQKGISGLEVGALYMMANRGRWHVDVIPKEAKLLDGTIPLSHTWRGQFIGQPDTLYYGPIPWPSPELRDWDAAPPPSNVAPIKEK